MDLRVKRVYDPPAPDDGLRVLVDRLWPRGLAKERARVDRWLESLAPSGELRRWFGHRPERWDGFRRRYREELARSPDALGELRAELARGRVTLLYGTRETRYNNAVALREMLLEAPPDTASPE